MKKSLLLMLFLALTWSWTANADETITLSEDVNQAIVPGTTYYFYDSGGSSSNYGTSETYTATFTCAGAITINFSSFTTESSSYCSNWDYMLIYDGDANTGTLLARGQTGCSSSTLTIGNNIVAESGVMTIKWFSDSSSPAAGWVATIVGAEPASNPKPIGLTVSDITHNSATLSWTEKGVATSWQICLNDDETNLINAGENPYTLSNLTPLTPYSAKVRSVGSEYSEWSSVVNFSTTAVATPVGNSWSDNFEGTSCGWELINGTLTNAWAWGTAASNGGTHALYISNDGGTTNAYTNSNAVMVYATKLLQFADGKYEFDYDWQANGESTFDYLRVALVPASVELAAGTSTPSGFSTTALPTGWIALDGGSKLNLVTAWQSKSVAINVTSGNYYLVLAWRDDTSGGTNPPAAVDNVSIVKMACPYDVADLAVDPINITTSSADISWTAGEATQWQIAYSKDNSFPAEKTTMEIVSNASASLTGLNASSTYFVKVRAYCGGSDFGAWSNVISFATECDALSTYPYSEKFDSYVAAEGLLPICWNRINTCTYSSYNASKYPRIYGYSAYSASNCLYLYSSYSSWSDYDPQPQYAILPEMENLAGKQITLQAKGYNSSSTFKIGVMSDPTVASTFVEIAEQELTTSYQEFIYDIPTDATGSYVAIKIDAASSSRTPNCVYIDDIVIDYPPACPKPSTPKCLDKTAHTAKLTWTLGEEGQSAWQIAVDTIAAFDPDTVSVLANLFDAADDTVVISGLRAGKLYYAYVRANCGTDGYSAWSKSDVSFLTASGKAAPTDLAVIEESLTSDEAKVNWQRNKTNDLHQSFDLYYSELNTMPRALNPDSLIENITDTFYLFQKLTHETTYYVWVRDNCGTDGQSAWSSSASFTTLASCAVPGSLSASNITAYTADVAWAIGLSAGYNVQYRTAAYFDGEVQQFGGTTKPADWTFYGNGVFDNHARVNIYGNNQRWLVTPAIQLAAGAQLSFDLALTAYSGTLAAPATTGVDDKFVVLVSTDNGATWTILRQWDNADGSKYVYNNIACSATGENVTIDLSSYADQSVMIAFYGESTLSNADNNLHIDNVAIGVPIAAGDWQTTSSTEKNVQLTSLIPETQYEVQVQGVCGAIETEWSESLFFTTIASCVAPTELAKSDVTAHGATLNWTSDGIAWQIMLNDDEENLINVTSKPYQLTDLAPETAYSAKVRKDCGNEYSDWSSAVSFTTLIACHVPTALAVELTPGNGTVATLSWTAGEEGQNAWQICLNGDEENLIDVTENPYQLTGLTPETAYTAKVRANCGDEDGKSAWSSAISFTPTDAYSITVNEGTVTNTYVPIYGSWVDDISKSQFIIPAADLASIQWGVIDKLTFHASTATAGWAGAQFEVYMAEVENTSLSSLADWTSMDKVMNAAHLEIANKEMVVVFDAPYQYMGGNLMIGILETVSGAFAGASFVGITATGASLGGYGTSISQQNFLPKMTIYYTPGEEPSCYKPTDLVVNYIGGTEATISFTGEATSYNIDVNGVVTNGVTSPYELTGLELATMYEVKVQADCGGGNLSEWTSAASFRTDFCMPEDQCILTFELKDAYGDGWNGAAIRVTDVLSGVVLGEMANENLNGTQGYGENELNIKTLSVCNGREIQFSWVSGSYDDETSFVVKDVNGQIICKHDKDATGPSEGVLANYVVDCTHKFYLAIGTSGYATFYDEDYAYTMPANLSGHTFNAATGLSDAIYEANQIIPAKEPLVMKAADNVQLPDTFILVEAETDALPSAGNDLKGNNEEGTIGTATDGNVYYVLSLNAAGEDESVGFYYMLEDGKGGFTMPAHKAYLMYNASLAPAAFYLFNGENNATWLDNLEGVEGTVKFMHEGNIYILRDSIIYDATGRKVRELK